MQGIHRYMKTTSILKRAYAILTVSVVAAAGVLNTLALQTASAAALTNTTIQELGGASNVTPMIASTGQSFALDFKTVGAGATSATINFNNFGAGTVNATQTISNVGCTTYFPNATLLPGSTTAAGATTIVTISSITALAATTEYSTILTSTTAMTNPVAGVYSALVTVGSDSKIAAFDVLASGANAYSITGSISPTFTMSLSGSGDCIASPF